MFKWFKNKKEDSTAAKLRQVNEKFINDWVAKEEKDLVHMAECAASQGKEYIHCVKLSDIPTASPTSVDKCHSLLIRALRKHKFKWIEISDKYNWIGFRW